MDMIVDLPASTMSTSLSRDPYDAILVVVDRLSKMTHFIPVRKTLKGEELAMLILREVIRLHGVPAKVITDRGSIFASGFWSDFMYCLTVRRGLSTSYHPQTDGQTERLNSVLEQYLRSYVSFSQDDWVDYLPMAEFTVNNSVNASTGKMPFQVVYGQDPQTIAVADLLPPELEQPAVDQAKRLDDICGQVKKALEKACEDQKKYYDKGRVAKTFKVGDQVWINLRNITSTRPSKKLDLRQEGPARIIEKIGTQAYRWSYHQACEYMMYSMFRCFANIRNSVVWIPTRGSISGMPLKQTANTLWKES